MRRKRNIWILVILAGVVTSYLYWINRPIDGRSVVGTYSGTYRDISFFLTIHNDGTYEYRCQEKYGTILTSQGKWEIEDGDRNVSKIYFHGIRLRRANETTSICTWAASVSRDWLGRVVIPIEVDSPMYFIKK
jgi:hypothetical protein